MAEGTSHPYTEENHIAQFTSISDYDMEFDRNMSEDEEGNAQDYYHYEYYSDTSTSTSTSTPTTTPYPKKKKHRQQTRIFKRRTEKVMKKSLLAFRSKVEDALKENSLFRDSHLALLNEEDRQGLKQNLKDIALWGVPLLPSKGHEGTDIILLKFLRAQGFKANDALEMLRKTLIWRVKEKIDQILEENLDHDQGELNEAVFIQGVDKEGHPTCFNVYGAFKHKNLFNKYFGTEKSRRDFLRWRIQFMEKSIHEKLDFREGGTHSFLLISDMKSTPRPGNRMNELGPMSKEAFGIFQQYYPELIYKHIIINTPFWYHLYHGLLAQYCTHGTRKKFVLARPCHVTQTLLEYISPNHIPLRYGGFGRPNDEDFTSEDDILEFHLRAGSMSSFKIPVSEGLVTIVWEVMVAGWDVTYKDEFVPDDEGSYKILLTSEKKMTEIVRNSFYIHEPGKILIIIKNITYIRKKVYIRRKSKITLPVYMTATTYDPQQINVY